VAYDFNGDGSSDILWRNIDGTVAIWLMNAAQPSSYEILQMVPLTWSIAGTGDFDGDGTSDILWRNTDGTVAIWLMKAGQPSSYETLEMAPLTWSIAGTGDFDGDGTSDILWRDTDGTVAIWLMKAGQPSSYEILQMVPSTWSIAGTGDFDGDGTSDILWRNIDGTVAIWLMKAGQPSSYEILQMVPSTWSIAGTGDFDGDGTSDILWRNTDGTVAIWLMKAGQPSSYQTLQGMPSTWSIAGTGDFDGDGTSDILWRNSNTGQLSTWIMSAAGQSGGGSLGQFYADWQIVGTGPPSPVIAVNGNRFINAAGNTVELVGTNISGLELQSSLWAGISGLSSAQWQALASTWSQLGQTINVIRLPLNSYSWLNLTCVDPGSGDAGNDYQANGDGTFTPDPMSAYQGDVEQTVTAITRAGLYVILDLQWDAPNNASGQPMCPVGQPAFASADHAPAFWTSVANAFQGNAAVIFELFNEPFGDNVYGNGVIQSGNTYTPGPDATVMANGGSWAYPFMMQDNANQNKNCGSNHNQSCQNELFNTNAPNPVQIAGELSLLSAIRATGAANVVLASPIGYAGEIETWLGSYASAGNPDPLGQFGVAWHLYGYAKGTTPPLSVLAAGYPIVITETYGFDAAINGGKNANGYTWAAQNNIGYLWWGLNNWGDQATPALYTKLAADVPWLDSTAP
jgi:hypothetical protein